MRHVAFIMPFFAKGDASTAQGCPTTGRATLGVPTCLSNRNAVPPRERAWHSRSRPEPRCGSEIGRRVSQGRRSSLTPTRGLWAEPRCGWKTDTDSISFSSTHGGYLKTSSYHCCITSCLRGFVRGSKRPISSDLRDRIGFRAKSRRVEETDRDKPLQPANTYTSI